MKHFGDKVSFRQIIDKARLTFRVSAPRLAFLLLNAALVFFAVACANVTPPPVPPSTPTFTRAAPTPTEMLPTATYAAHTPTRGALRNNTPTATNAPPTATATRAATTVPTPTFVPIPGLRAGTLAAWQELAARIQAQDTQTAHARADEFWKNVTASQRVPLVLEDATVLLYKGDANSVTWRGDFSYWQFGPGIEGRRIADTDLWYGVADFPRDSRVNYQIVLNNTEWILDPANPNTQKGGLGLKSVFTMPDFRVTDVTEHRTDVKPGTLTDWITFDSNGWGGPLNYRVYTPANFEDMDALPVLYVTDGNDFGDEEMGAMQIALDNLIADGRIQPVMAVFIDARDPNPPNRNQREVQFLTRPEDLARFLTDELVVRIDAQYRTVRSPAARAIVGTSYGGVFATYAALKYPDVFGNLVAFSPAYWVLETPDGTGAADTAAGARRMNEFVQRALNCKTSAGPCPAQPLKIWLSAGIQNWDVGDLKDMAEPLRARGDAVKVLRVQEGHSWGAWRGEIDEMLEYFWGK